MGRKAIKVRKQENATKKRRNRRIRTNCSMGKQMDALDMSTTFRDLVDPLPKRKRGTQSGFRRDRACNDHNLEKVENILLNRTKVEVEMTPPFCSTSAEVELPRLSEPKRITYMAGLANTQTPYRKSEPSAVIMPAPMNYNLLQGLPGYSRSLANGMFMTTYATPLGRVPMNVMPDSAILKEVAAALGMQPKVRTSKRNGLTKRG